MVPIQNQHWAMLCVWDCGEMHPTFWTGRSGGVSFDRIVHTLAGWERQPWLLDIAKIEMSLSLFVRLVSILPSFLASEVCLHLFLFIKEFQIQGTLKYMYKKDLQRAPQKDVCVRCRGACPEPFLQGGWLTYHLCSHLLGRLFSPCWVFSRAVAPWNH